MNFQHGFLTIIGLFPLFTVWVLVKAIQETPAKSSPSKLQTINPQVAQKDSMNKESSLTKKQNKARRYPSHRIESEWKSNSTSSQVHSHEMLTTERIYTKNSNYWFRQKREVKNLNIKLLLVVDSSVTKVWFERLNMNGDWREQVRLMKAFYPTIIKTIEAQLSTLQIPNVSFRITLVEWYINSNPNSKIFKGRKNKDKILQDFQKWISDQNFPAFDHAILFIDNRLIKNTRKKHKDDLRMATICTNRSLSVVPEYFDSTTVTMATHELAHSLGIRHDGDGNDCTSNNHLMTDNPAALATDKFITFRKFSPCSSNYINEKTLACLENAFIPSRPSLLPGQILEADLQCRYAIGSHSYVCRSKYQSRYDSVCTELWCADAEGHCIRISPYDGTTCGEKKWCFNGFCTEDKKAPFVPDDCPFLDQNSIIPGFNMTCDQVSKERLYECFQPVVALACCHICPTKKCNGETCCMHNDRHVQCTGLPSYACYSRDMSRLCCETCKKHCRKDIANCSCGDRRAACLNITRIDCYTKQDDCCETCSQLRNPNRPDCEYGDRSQECLIENCKYYDPRRLNKVCCETCSEFITTTTTTEIAITVADKILIDIASNSIHLIGSTFWILFCLVFSSIFY